MSAHYYRGMLTQKARMAAFRAAIDAAVRPDARVLEIGAGLATYSMFAARAGAGRVWAVEGGTIVPVTRQVVRDNGFADTIEVLDGWYPSVGPSEPVDVVIYEDYSARLLDRWGWSVLDHVARAALAPGGVLIPSRARLWIAPVHVPRYFEVVAPFSGEGDELYGFDWEASRDHAANTPLTLRMDSRDLLGEAALVADLSLHPAPDAGTIEGSGTWTFDRPAEVHGLAYWFDLELGADTWLSNAPADRPVPWGHLYLPAPRSMVVPPGEPLRAGIGFDRGPGGEPGWMRWQLSVAGREWKAHEFRSSLSPADRLQRAGPGWQPRLGGPGHAARRILELSDGTRSVDAIVVTLVEEGLARTRPQAVQLVQNTLAGRAV